MQYCHSVGISTTETVNVVFRFLRNDKHYILCQILFGCECPSPDGNGILFWHCGDIFVKMTSVCSQCQKRYSGQRETAPKKN